MEYRMRKKIKVCLESNDNVGELTKKCQSLKQLERGLVTDAERKADFPATIIRRKRKVLLFGQTLWIKTLTE
jgi:hypothetical protein